MYLQKFVVASRGHVGVLRHDIGRAIAFVEGCVPVGASACRGSLKTHFNPGALVLALVDVEALHPEVVVVKLGQVEVSLAENTTRFVAGDRELRHLGFGGVARLVARHGRADLELLIEDSGIDLVRKQALLGLGLFGLA